MSNYLVFRRLNRCASRRDFWRKTRCCSVATESRWPMVFNHRKLERNLRCKERNINAIKDWGSRIPEQISGIQKTWESIWGGKFSIGSIIDYIGECQRFEMSKIINRTKYRNIDMFCTVYNFLAFRIFDIHPIILPAKQYILEWWLQLEIDFDSVYSKSSKKLYASWPRVQRFLVGKLPKIKDQSATNIADPWKCFV